MQSSKKEWSGRWDSNPRLDLGKVPYYPYTTAAQNQRDFNTPANRGQVPRRSDSERSENLRISVPAWNGTFLKNLSETLT
jgi:hypothetical protein